MFYEKLEQEDETGWILFLIVLWHVYLAAFEHHFVNCHFSGINKPILFCHEPHHVSTSVGLRLPWTLARVCPKGASKRPACLRRVWRAPALLGAQTLPFPWPSYPSTREVAKNCSKRESKWENALDSDNNAVIRDWWRLSIRTRSQSGAAQAGPASYDLKLCNKHKRSLQSIEFNHDKYIYLSGACITYKKLN